MKISVIKKEVGRLPERIIAENDIDAFQDLIDGYVEEHRVADGLYVLCDENGNIFGRPYNVTINGIDYVGTVLLVGFDGEDFTDAPEVDDAIWKN